MAVKDDAGQYYGYTVIPELPTALIVLLFAALTMFAVITKRKARREARQADEQSWLRRKSNSG